MWKIIVGVLIILLFFSPVYGAKKQISKEPIIINTEVLRDHQRLYQSYAAEVINNPDMNELPILPKIWFDIRAHNKYIWGQQKTLLELLK